MLPAGPTSRWICVADNDRARPQAAEEKNGEVNPERQLSFTEQASATVSTFHLKYVDLDLISQISPVHERTNVTRSACD